MRVLSRTGRTSTRLREDEENSCFREGEILYSGKVNAFVEVMVSIRRGRRALLSNLLAIKTATNSNHLHQSVRD